jgi:hypothetical protein
MFTSAVRTVLAFSFVSLLATPALAGPPLICHPFATEPGGTLIAWGTGQGWNTPDHTYDLARLVGDATAALTPDAPTLTRMENLRRATIYAMRDPVIAEQLLKALMSRALATTSNGNAWFDAGYLIEAYRQGEHLRGNRKSAAWTAIDETIRVDGYGFVKKAMAMNGASAAMEFAASLMTQGAIAEGHRARAAKAGPGSLVARNLAQLAY